MVTMEGSSKNTNVNTNKNLRGASAPGFGWAPSTGNPNPRPARVLSLAFDSQTVRIFREVFSAIDSRGKRSGGEGGEDEEAPPTYSYATQSTSLDSGRDDDAPVKTIPGLLIIMAIELVICGMYTFQSLILWSAGGGAGVLGVLVVLCTLILLWASLGLTRALQTEACNVQTENKRALYVRWKVILVGVTFLFLLISIPLASSLPVSFLQFDVIKSYFVFYGALGLLLGLSYKFRHEIPILRMEMAMDWRETPQENLPGANSPEID